MRYKFLLYSMHIYVHISVDINVQNLLPNGRHLELSKLISLHVFTPDTPFCVFVSHAELKA